MGFTTGGREGYFRSPLKRKTKETFTIPKVQCHVSFSGKGKDENTEREIGSLDHNKGKHLSQMKAPDLQRGVNERFNKLYRAYLSLMTWFPYSRRSETSPEKL